MESIGETLPSWLLSSPGLVGAGVILIALVLVVLRRRSVVVHGTLGGQREPLPALSQAGDAPDTPTAFEKIEQEIEAGRLINAIKLYRDETGAGLKAAKDAVERMQKDLAALPSGAVAHSAPVAAGRDQQGSADATLEAEVAGLLSRDQKIEAIKLTRNRLGLGLKEAKDYVDDVERRGARP